MPFRNIVAIKVKKLAGQVNPREETPVEYDFPGPDLRAGMFFDKVRFGEVFITKVNRRITGTIEESLRFKDGFATGILRTRLGSLKEKIPVIAEAISGVVQKIHYTTLGEYIRVPPEVIEGFLRTLIDEYTPPIEEGFTFSSTRTSELNDPLTFQESFTTYIAVAGIDVAGSLAETFSIGEVITGDWVEITEAPAIIVPVGADALPEAPRTEPVGADGFPEPGPDISLLEGPVITPVSANPSASATDPDPVGGNAT